MASSSPVVMPAAVRSRISARVSPTTSPARRISRIWSGVLVSRRWRPNITPVVQTLERGLEPRGDLVDVAHAVDLAQHAVLAVDLGQRGRLAST